MRHLSRHWKTKEFKEESGMKTQPWRIYKRNQIKPFKISRTGVENFKDCQRCFYLNVVKGLKDIDSIPFTLNNTVDELVKREFDICRRKQVKHQVMIENNLEAIPYNHKELDNWRNSRSKGVEFYHKEINLILSGGVDDIWLKIGSKPDELIIVDYKAQAKKEIDLNNKTYLSDIYHQGYKFQLEFYRYLFINIGFKIHPKGYFLVYNAKQERKSFGKKMDFQRFLVPYEYEKNSFCKIEKIVREMKKLMDSDKIPIGNKSCQECAFIRAGSKFIK